MNLSVLLIEDDSFARKNLMRVMRKEGYTVSGARDGLEGINAFKEEKPDIVITDVKMPKIDGLEVMHRIKELSPETEVILITGHGDVDMAIFALREGALDYIKKPIDIDQLLLSLGRAKVKICERKSVKIDKSILIIEDNEKAREVLHRIYEKEGYKVFSAANGKEGIDIFSDHKIDIVLSDIQMPIMDGLEFLSEAKSINCDCEVIMLSGYGDESKAVESMRNGAINFITKPIDVEQLLQATQKAMDKLHLQRSYTFQSRELELSKQIISRFEDEGRWGLEKSIEYDVAKEVVDFMNISYVLIDESLNVCHANEAFTDSFKFSPRRVDAEFLRRTALADISVEQMREKVAGILEGSEKRVVCFRTGSEKGMLLLKGYNENEGEREDKVVVVVGGRYNSGENGTDC